jgi:hypothetical protein
MLLLDLFNDALENYYKQFVNICLLQINVRNQDPEE